AVRSPIERRRSRTILTGRDTAANDLARVRKGGGANDRLSPSSWAFDPPCAAEAAPKKAQFAPSPFSVPGLWTRTRWPRVWARRGVARGGEVKKPGTCEAPLLCRKPRLLLPGCLGRSLFNEEQDHEGEEGISGLLEHGARRPAGHGRVPRGLRDRWLVHDRG